MNWEQVQGQWKQLKGKLKMKWGKLTDDDLDFIAGKKDVLVGKIQERYGLQKEEAMRQVEEWNSSLDSESVAERDRKIGKAS
ncbi:MAG: CsbD family protein [Candidatus Sulfotelmatobacter sp.]|nr:CsbD family protein [Candidatus Sulfotelmatobacter sp.]